MSIYWKALLVVGLVSLGLHCHILVASSSEVSCLGTPDPVCFTLEEIMEELVSSSVPKRSIPFHTDLEVGIGVEFTDDSVLRLKREKKKKKAKKAKKIDDDYKTEESNLTLKTNESPILSITTTTTEGTPTNTITESPSSPDNITESPPSPDTITAIPLSDSEMAQSKLKQYSKDTMTDFYPPWTYSGFYSPKHWDTIPAWYFRKREVKKTGKFTGLRNDMSSGISFMEFTLVEGTDGTHSENCSNSLFPAPLDIITENAQEEPSFVEFNFVNYDTKYAFTIFLPEDGTDLLFVKLINVGRQNLVSKKPSIDKGATTGTPLTLDRLLIHYGNKHTEGSEHRINGKSFGMELQFFFNRQTKDKPASYWNTLESYMIDKDSSLFGKNLLVLSILVEVGPSTERSPPAGKEYNEGMKYLSKAVQQFWSIRNLPMDRAFKIGMKSLSMKDFFDVPISGLYYSYYGSLTHPPCLNNTRYAVYETPIYISHEMWRSFLFIPSEFSDRQFVAGNFRPLESMTLRSNYTGEIVTYAEARLNLSYTVRKSKRGTTEERMRDYDYYEE